MTEEMVTVNFASCLSQYFCHSEAWFLEAGDTDSGVDAAVEESLIASLLGSYPEPDEFDVTKPIDKAELLGERRDSHFIHNTDSSFR